MDTIIIEDLGVFYCIGVTDKERAQPQQLSISIQMFQDISAAAASDDLASTIDYHTVARRVIGFGQERSWKLLETVAVELAEAILLEFKPERVTIEARKFAVPESRHVAVRVTRSR
jgi:dihydroneopterin aldolase